MAGRSKSSGILYPLALLLILLVVATVSRRDPTLESFKRVVQSRAVDISALGSGDTREILQRLQAVHLVPAEPSVSGSTDSSAGQSQIFSLEPIPVDRLADVLRIDPKWLEKGVPIVVLLVDPADLEELHANPFARGREWERPAFLAYLENGELHLTTRVGVRLHGGWGRAKRNRRSYRIYFRSRYGIDHFPLAFFPTGGSRSPRVLVIRNDHSFDSTKQVAPLTSSLAYDIVRRVGVPAPQTKPVVFYVNGESLGMFHLTERIDRDYLLAHYGHDDFVLASTEAVIFLGEEPERWLPASDLDRVRIGPLEVYQEFRQWAKDSSDLDFKAIAERVDIDNLSRWLLAILYCSNRDPTQGPLLLNLRQQKEEWFWLPWDFDASFRHVLRPRMTIGLLLEPPNKVFMNDERRWLLKQLLNTSPEYRDYLALLFVETMNHRTTTPFVESAIRRHRRTAEAFEVRSDHFDRIQKFLLYQPKLLSRQLQRTLQQGPIFNVTVTAPANRELEVDGYPYGSSFQGMYFSGMLTDISIAESDRLAFKFWRVNGQRFKETPLRVEINSNLKIRAVFKKSHRRKAA